MSPVQLAVIPDEWTGLPAFIPGERPADEIRISVRGGELVIPADMARQLAASYADLARKAEDIAELVKRGLIDVNGHLIPVAPAAFATGNSYQFASGGIVVQ